MFVSFLRQAEPAGGTARYGQREMEAVIRHALAETNVDISGINAQVAFEIQGSVTAFIAWQRAWRPPLIDALLAAAEQIALRRMSTLTINPNELLGDPGMCGHCSEPELGCQWG